MAALGGDTWDVLPPGTDPVLAVPPFSVVSWNVLADGLAGPRAFPSVDPSLLTWASRGPRIVTALLSMHADIIALQELNRLETVIPAFPGHAVVFASKLDSPAVREGCPPDGCALLVSRTRFDVVHAETVFYVVDSEGGSGVPLKPLSNQLGIVATLRDRLLPSGLVVVACTHLAADKGVSTAAAATARRALRIEQARQLTSVIGAAQFSALCSRGPSGAPGAAAVPVVLCGDFNDNADEGRRPSAADATDAGVGGEGDGSLYALLTAPASVAGGLDLCDVYAAAGLAPAWTMRARGESRRLDWLLASQPRAVYTSPRFVCTALLRHPAEGSGGAAARAVGGGELPSATVPSDHVPVGAAFAWLQDTAVLTLEPRRSF